MPRTRLAPFALVLVAALAALVTAVAGASGTASPSTMRLVAVDLPKTEVYVDNGKKGEALATSSSSGSVSIAALAPGPSSVAPR